MYKDLPTKIVGVRVHITGYHDDEAEIILRGYAVDDHGTRIDGSKNLRRTAKTPDDIPSAERHLASAIENALPKKQTGSDQSRTASTALDPHHPMVQAFNELCAGEYKVSSTWNDVVETRNISGFRRRLLPRILEYMNKPFTLSDQNRLLTAIADDVRTHGNSRKNETKVLKTAKKDMAAYATVYEALRRIDPMLPVLDLVPPRLSKNITDEQLKSLPREVRRKFARKLRQLITKEPVLVLGTVIMWDAGTRTAEAAAVIPALDIEIIGTTSILKIMWQEKNGIRIGVLKTDAAYRKVPLSAWGRKMVKLCCDHIDAWPQDQNIAPMTAEVLRKFITEVLHDCGLEAGYWTAAHESEARNPDRDSQGNPIMDVVAYTLRHDRASIWRNICGLTAAECDYLLGTQIILPKNVKLTIVWKRNGFALLENSKTMFATMSCQNIRESCHCN